MAQPKETERARQKIVAILARMLALAPESVPLDARYQELFNSDPDAVRAFGEVEALREDHETAFLTERISGAEAAERAKALQVLACIRALS